MSEEEFITKFYSCDNEEQFLKDVYHNLNCLEQENQQLKQKLSILSVKPTIPTTEEKLKYRIEKAIEYINNNDEFYYGDELYDEYEKIINLLKGDKE